jgi:hypothetical protein
MRWADLVLASCQAAAIPTFLPTILGASKPTRATSIANAILVAVVAMTQVSLRLWFSALAALLLSICWAVVAITSWRRARESRSRGLISCVWSNRPTASSGVVNSDSGVTITRRTARREGEVR